MLQVQIHATFSLTATVYDGSRLTSVCGGYTERVWRQDNVPVSLLNSELRENTFLSHASPQQQQPQQQQQLRGNKRRNQTKEGWNYRGYGRRIAAAAQQQLQRGPSNSHTQQAVSSSNSCSSKGPPATALSLDSCQHVQHQLLPVPCPHSRQHAQQQQLQCQ